MSSIVTQNAHLFSTAQHLAAFAGSDANTALVGWIDALTAAYKEELVSVLPEGLLALQTRVLQMDALRSLALGAVQTNGRI